MYSILQAFFTFTAKFFKKNTNGVRAGIILFLKVFEINTKNNLI